MTSIENLLNTIIQIMETFLNGLGNLFNANLHGLESLSLLLGISAVIAWFKQLIKHRRQKGRKTAQAKAPKEKTNVKHSLPSSDRRKRL